MLLPWRSIANAMAQLFKASPDLARRLALASAQIVHATAAFVGWATVNDWSYDQIAQALLEQDIQNLLSIAIPNKHPRFFGSLKKLGDHAFDLCFYRDLNAALNGPASDVILAQSSINRESLEIARKLATDPLLLRCRHGIGTSKLNLESVMSAVHFLRLLGLASSSEATPDGAGINSIYRRIKADLKRAEAPPAPFSIPIGWRQVHDVGFLWQIGRQLGNCLSIPSVHGDRHLLTFLSGQSIFMHTVNDPLILISLESIGRGIWTIGDTSMRPSKIFNEEDGFEAALSKQMALSGHAFVVLNPMHALTRLANSNQDRSIDDIVDLDEFIDET